jgi:hypothetical protein
MGCSGGGDIVGIEDKIVVGANVANENVVGAVVGIAGSILLLFNLRNVYLNSSKTNLIHNHYV